MPEPQGTSNHSVKVLDKAKKSCENAGEAIFDHFADIGKMIGLARGAQREIEERGSR